MTDNPKGASPPAPDSVGEARLHFRPRLKLRWPVVLAEVTDEAEGAARTTLAVTHGVSVGGAFIETDLEVSPGLELHLWLHPPGPTPQDTPGTLRLRARVRWRNPEATDELPRGFGVQFQALTATEEVALHAYFSAPRKVV